MQPMIDSLLKLLALIALFAVLLAVPSPSHAEIAIGKSVEVRILWDNSASMCPGYQPPPNGKQCWELGGKFYHQNPAVREWLASFVARQSIFDASEVAMATFTTRSESGRPGQFRSSDVRQVLSSPLKEFDAGKALDNFPDQQGSHTFIAESLDTYSKNFEGLLWLITDNIVQTGSGEPAAGVEKFFQGIKDGEKFRSVHLYKKTFNEPDSGKAGSLAIYGFLISKTEIDSAALEYFEKKFRGLFLEATFIDESRQLFPGAYWKLKKIDKNALELSDTDLKIEIVQLEKGIFYERQKIELLVQGRIKSHLTQHKVVGGRFSLRADAPFKPTVTFPEGSGELKFGLPEISPGAFSSSSVNLSGPIAPRGSQSFSLKLVSREALPLETKGFRAWFISASKGLKVEYRAKARALFEQVDIEFVEDSMEGIFGAGLAPEIFGIARSDSLEAPESTSDDIAFTLETSYGRYLLFALLILVFLTVAVFLFLYLTRKEAFKIIIGDHQTPVALRRLGRYEILHEGNRLGSLRCTLGGRGEFLPDQTSAAVQVRPATQSGSWDVQIRDFGALRMKIEAMGGKPVRTAGGGGAGAASPRSGRRGRVRPPGPGRGGSSSPLPPPPSAGNSTPIPPEEPSPPVAPAPSTTEERPTRRPTISRPGGGNRPKIKRPGS